MEKEDVTGNFRYLFPETKEDAKLTVRHPQDCFLLQMVPVQRCILKTVKYLQWSFLQNYLMALSTYYFCEKLHLTCLSKF